MAWLIWLVFAAGFAIAELLTLSLVLAMFAGGAAAAAIVAAANGPIWLQFVVFVVVSAALLAGVRPFARRHMEKGPIPRTGSDRLVGYQAVVLSDTDAYHGRVRLDGGEWSARAADQRFVYPAGSNVRIVAIDGATALIGPDPSFPQPIPDTRYREQ